MARCAGDALLPTMESAQLEVGNSPVFSPPHEIGRIQSSTELSAENNTEIPSLEDAGGSGASLAPTRESAQILQQNSPDSFSTFENGRVQTAAENSTENDGALALSRPVAPPGAVPLDGATVLCEVDGAQGIRPLSTRQQVQGSDPRGTAADLAGSPTQQGPRGLGGSLRPDGTACHTETGVAGGSEPLRPQQEVEGSNPAAEPVGEGQQVVPTVSVDGVVCQRRSWRDMVRERVAAFWQGRQPHQPERGRDLESNPGHRGDGEGQLIDDDVIPIDVDVAIPQSEAGTDQQANSPIATLPADDGPAEFEQQSTPPSDQADGGAACPICGQFYAGKRGVAQHLRRDAKNACAALHRELRNNGCSHSTPPPQRKRAREPSRQAARTKPRTRDFNIGSSRQTTGSFAAKSATKRGRRKKDTPACDTAAEASPGTPQSQAATSQVAAEATQQAAETPEQRTTEPPATLTPARARPTRDQQPITRRKALRVPRLTEPTRQKLLDKMRAIASETTAKVATGSWEEVEAAAGSFTSALYDAIWYADKNIPSGMPDRNTRRNANRNNKSPDPPTPQETRRPRDSPRVAQAKDDVDKALAALRQEEARQQQQGQQQPVPLEDQLRKRALEHKLRSARRRVITALEQESAHRLQTLYMNNRKKCVEQLLADEDRPLSQDCAIPLVELERYFKEQHSRQSIDLTSEEGREFLHGMTRAPPGVAIDPYFTEDEVRAQLQKSNLQSAAGPDGIGFFVYRRFEEVLVPPLVALYNACATHRRIPWRWKESVTVLIPKGGDPKDVRNWRPINLQDCIYKLYAAMWARKITEWAVKTGVASKSQKGFMPVNGCHEHLFLAQSILQTSRRAKKPLYMTYYDLKNAFGSIPHELIHAVLRQQGLPDQVREIVADLYDGATFCVATKEGCTDTIEIQRGVKQGCPLSPILFNLAIEPLVQQLARCQGGFKLKSPRGAPPVEVTNTVYADDIKAVASTPDGIRALHKCVERFLRWAGLRANPAKCATLGLKVGKTKQELNPVNLRLHGEVLPSVKLGEAYKYLGVKDALETAVHQDQILSVMRRVRKDSTKILRSGLLPWQKLDAIRTFVFSRLEYHLRYCYPYKRDMMAFDSHMRAALREAFKLPKGVTTEIFHQPIANGGMGCSSIQTVAAATQIGHGIQMLNSSDSVVRSVAEGQLLEVISRRFTYTPAGADSDRDAIVAFLNGKELDCLKRKANSRHQGDVRSLWSELPGLLAGLRMEVVSTARGYAVRKQGAEVCANSQALIRALKQRIVEQQREAWTNKVDQGKNAAYQSADSNAFLRGPTHLSPQDVYFVLKARTAQVPTRSYLRKIRAVRSSRCRHCTADPETLAHILNHCPHNMDSKIKERHDCAMRKIAATVRGSNANRGKTLLVDSSPEDIETTLRPDLILRDEKNKKIAIVDLAITFEDHRKNAFVDARARKVEKYQDLKQEYEARGYRVALNALVYGSLGCISANNEEVLRRDLGVAPHTARTLQRSISLSCIRHSSTIWRYHAADNGKLGPARGIRGRGRQAG